MIIYISGPITGISNNNKRAFNNASTAIRFLNNYNAGPFALKIINPLHIGTRVRAAFSEKRREVEWADYMRACIKKLCDCDCVFFLPNWPQSEGATMERYISKKLNIPIADNMDELKKIIRIFYDNA